MIPCGVFRHPYDYIIPLAPSSPPLKRALFSVSPIRSLISRYSHFHCSKLLYLPPSPSLRIHPFSISPITSLVSFYFHLPSFALFIPPHTKFSLFSHFSDQFTYTLLIYSLFLHNPLLAIFLFYISCFHSYYRLCTSQDLDLINTNRRKYKVFVFMALGYLNQYDRS